MNFDDKKLDGIRSLRTAWVTWCAICIVVYFSGYWLIGKGWLLPDQIAWAILSGGMFVLQLSFLWRNLCENVHPANGLLFSGLGLANWVTLSRGAMVALLAGFLAGSWPAGWLGWAPGVLYLSAVSLDYVDGSIARFTHTETRLGEKLDMFLDGQAVLLGSLLAVRYSQAPVWYLLVGLARYLFLIGEWWYRRNGWVISPLPPNPFRRALAGSQMGFIAALLFPVLSPLATQVAASLFMLPFLANFLRDWLWVSGKTSQPMDPPARRTSGWVTFVPLIFRGVLVALLSWLMVRQFQTGNATLPVLVTEALVLLGTLLGAASRLAAMAGMILSAFILKGSSLTWYNWLLLLSSMALFLLGSGRFSLWKPEEWIIYNRPGELKS